MHRLWQVCQYWWNFNMLRGYLSMSDKDNQHGIRAWREKSAAGLSALAVPGYSSGIRPRVIICRPKCDTKQKRLSALRHSVRTSRPVALSMASCFPSLVAIQSARARNEERSHQRVPALPRLSTNKQGRIGSASINSFPTTTVSMTPHRWPAGIYMSNLIVKTGYTDCQGEQSPGTPKVS
jgi:hypothetical protein